MANRIAFYNLDSVNDLLSDVELVMPTEWFSERYNIAPLSAAWIANLDIVRPRLTPAQWGLIPPWAKPGQFQRPLTHARAETIWEKSSFKSLVRRYRGLLVCNGFYVFPPRSARAPIHYITNSDNAVALGVVWQYNVDGNTEIAVINTAAGELANTLNTRVPLVVDRQNLNDWLTTDKSRAINAMLRDGPSSRFQVRAVSSFVRDPLSEGRACIEPPQT